MMRRSVLFALPALALAVILLLPDTSFAQRWGRARYGGGYYGNYGNYGGDGYGSGYYGSGYGGYGYGYGARGGLIGRRYGGGYYGGGYGMGYGDGFYGTPYYVSPYDAALSAGQPVGDTITQASFYPSAQQPDMTLGRILVRVPPDADVLFDGNATQQKGADRMFETPSLDPNKSYSYDVTAQWKDQNGQQHKEKRTVQPMPGRTVVVNFMQSQQGQPGSEQPLRKDSKNRPEIRDQDR